MDGTYKILSWKDTGSSIIGRVNGGTSGSASYTRSGSMSTNRFCVGGILRASFSYGFTGNIKEIIISSPNSDSDRQKIEGYLAHKLGLVSNLASSHPYNLGSPLASSGTPAFITDTPFGSGKAIDLVDGHVEIPTGEAEDIFDGGSGFSVSAWVKGWPANDLQAVISKGSIMDLSVKQGLKAWYDASSASNFSTSTTADTTPANNGHAHRWKDLSGNGYDAVTLAGIPIWKQDGFNGKATIDLSNDSVKIENSASDFDGWNDLVIFAPLYQTAYDHFSNIFSKGNKTGWANSNTHDFGWLLNMHRNDWGGHRIWGPAINTSTGGNKYKTTSSEAIWTHSSFKGGPSLITLRYSSSNGSSMSTNLIMRVNGKNLLSSGISGPLKSTTHPVAIGGTGNGGGTWQGRISEFLIYNADLGQSNIEKVEGYLAQKWGLSLDSDHPYKALDGWTMHRGIGDDDFTVNVSNAANAQTASHSTDLSGDNQWHNIVSTYDGLYRKIYIDGVETLSVSASGLASSTNKALVLGAIDLNSSAAASDETKTVAAANHSKVKMDEVRFYDRGLTATEVTNLYGNGKGDLASSGGFATIPSVINATAGTALSSTVSAAFINPVYSAYNLPNGLSINSTTGEISGTPTVGGSHVISVTASGGSTTAPKKAASTITYSAPTTAPKFGAPGAQNIVGDSALILAENEQSGAFSNTVDLFWDTADRGTTNASDWNGSALAVGSGKEGFYGKQLADLSPGQTYYYRARSNLSLSPIDIVEAI